MKKSKTYFGKVGPTDHKERVKKDAGMIVRKKTSAPEGRRVKMLLRLGRLKTTSVLSVD